MDNKIILVHYIDVRDISQSVARDRMISYAQRVVNPSMTNHEELISFMLPVMSESRIECINPKLVDERDYDEAKKMLERLEKQAAEFYKMEDRYQLALAGAKDAASRWNASPEPDADGNVTVHFLKIGEYKDGDIPVTPTTRKIPFRLIDYFKQDFGNRPINDATIDVWLQTHDVK